MLCCVKFRSFSHSEDDDITYYAVKMFRYVDNGLNDHCQLHKTEAKHILSKINYSTANKHETASKYKIQVIMKALSFRNYCFILFFFFRSRFLNARRTPDYPIHVLPARLSVSIGAIDTISPDSNYNVSSIRLSMTELRVTSHKPTNAVYLHK